MLKKTVIYLVLLIPSFLCFSAIPSPCPNPKDVDTNKKEIDGGPVIGPMVFVSSGGFATEFRQATILTAGPPGVGLEFRVLQCLYIGELGAVFLRSKNGGIHPFGNNWRVNSLQDDVCNSTVNTNCLVCRDASCGKAKPG